MLLIILFEGEDDLTEGALSQDFKEDEVINTKIFLLHLILGVELKSVLPHVGRSAFLFFLLLL